VHDAGGHNTAERLDRRSVFCANRDPALAAQARVVDNQGFDGVGDVVQSHAAGQCRLLAARKPGGEHLDRRGPGDIDEDLPVGRVDGRVLDLCSDGIADVVRRDRSPHRNTSLLHRAGQRFDRGRRVGRQGHSATAAGDRRTIDVGGDRSGDVVGGQGRAYGRSATGVHEGAGQRLDGVIARRRQAHARLAVDDRIVCDVGLGCGCDVVQRDRSAGSERASLRASCGDRPHRGVRGRSQVDGAGSGRQVRTVHVGPYGAVDIIGRDRCAYGDSTRDLQRACQRMDRRVVRRRHAEPRIGLSRPSRPRRGYR